MNNLSVDELLNKAFSLACFILGSRQDAVRTVEEAMARLDVTTAAQGKRLYYKSASSWMGGSKADRYRNKVLFSEVHLLQRLVYIASEPYEQREEQKSVSGSSGEEALLIHFIKHLVRITTRRNSFYVTLGLSRLLYNYTTAETMEVYNAVIQDPERVKDDYYYRSRKGVLMQELKKRFGDLLEVARGPRGEERFRASDNQAKFSELAAECLAFFTPWYTNCLVPAGVNPIMDGITSLSSRGQKEEDKVEVDRIHAVLHPSCHDRLVKALGFDAPAQRLEVPHFFLTRGSSGGEGAGGGGERERKNPMRLAPDELDEIKGHLDEQSGRRKKAFAGLMRIIVDGNEHARLDLSRSSHARFALDDEAELLEVRATVDGDDLLLASHLFAHEEAKSRQQKAKASIILEGGQKLTINVAPVNDKEGALVDVAYSETRALRAASLYLRQLTASSNTASGNRSWMGARVPALALGFALLMLSAFGIVQFLRNKNTSPTPSETATVNQPGENPIVETPPVAKDETGTPKVASSPLEESAANDKDAPRKLTRRKPAPATAAVKPENEVNVGLPRERQPGQREVAERQPLPNENAPTGSERNRTTRPEDDTRGPEDRPSAATLVEVKKIYVELRGDAALSGSVREKMITSLSAGGRFVAAESKDEADALLRVTVEGVAGAAGKFSLRAELINVRGKIIWASNRAGETGSIEIVAGSVIEGLLDEVRKLEGRR
jgi:hypothetical protein